MIPLRQFYLRVARDAANVSRQQLRILSGDRRECFRTFYHLNTMEALQ
jgi:hypothetical protein